MSSVKEKFKQFCQSNTDIPIFLTYNWINSISPSKNWDVVIKESGNEIQGFFVYYHKTKLGQKYITLPHHTPYMGLWINYPEGQKQTTRISYERKVTEELIEQLPPFDMTVIHLHPDITNWQPFYWKDYKQTTRYTYIIPNNIAIESAYQNLRENIRREVKKAEKSIIIEQTTDVSELYELKRSSTQNTKEELSYSLEDLKNITEKLPNNSVLYKAIENNKTIAAILTVHDKNTTYYLSGAILPEYKTSGALSLLLWTAIQNSLSENRSFNFEGSMIKAVERYFSSFGAEQIPYHRITKTNSLVAKTKEILSEI